MKTLMVNSEKIVLKYTIFRVNEPKIACPFLHEKSGKNSQFFRTFHLNSRVNIVFHSSTKNFVFRNEF